MSSTEKLDVMYGLVSSRLKMVTSTLDLVPYINALMTVKNLKIQLSMALHHVYIESKQQIEQQSIQKSHRKAKNASHSPDSRFGIIQSLFLQLQRFNDVKKDLSLKAPPQRQNNGISAPNHSKPAGKHVRRPPVPPPPVPHSPAATSVHPFNTDDCKCDSIAHCIPLKRMIKALLYYDNIMNIYHQKRRDGRDNNAVQEWSTYFNEPFFKFLLNDYHHLLLHHLKPNDGHLCNAVFEEVYHELIKFMKPCDILKCDKFRRNRRIREHDASDVLTADRHELINFYVDTLDCIHCYFLHSFDLGMRLTSADVDTEIYCTDHESDKKHKKRKVDDTDFYTDKTLSNLQQFLDEKLMPLRRYFVIKGGQNKFFSNMNDETDPTVPRTLAPVCKNVFPEHKQRKFETIVSELIPHLTEPVSDIVQWLKHYIDEEEFSDEAAIRLDLEDKEYSNIRENMQAHFNWSDGVTLSLIHNILLKDIFNDANVPSMHEAEMKQSHSFDGSHNNQQQQQQQQQPGAQYRSRTKSTFSTSTSYDFGHKFYYWDEYKENNQQDYGPNIGYKKKDWYVVRKYADLKQEIVENKIFTLPVQQYRHVMKKAEMFLGSNVCLRSRSADLVSCEYYKIRPNQPLTAEHLMSLCLYCDYIDLAFAFRKTFRPISDQETNEQLKNRHREFWNLSKILSETVELYGESVSACHIKTFYYGVSFLVSFPNFISHFCGPTSASSELQVSTLFSDDCGIILDLVAENEYSNLKAFNCAWLSAYGHENEMLFFGGYRPLKFKSIRLMQPSQNYALFIKALSLFGKVVKGKNLTAEMQQNITKIDYKIIKSLMRHYMTTVEYRNRSPSYINNLFKSFCDSKQFVHINIVWMNEQYPGFKKYLMCSVPNEQSEQQQQQQQHTDNMVSFEIIGALFPYCQEVIVWDTGHITDAYVLKLIQQLRVLNQQQRSDLKRIKLCNVLYHRQLLTSRFEQQYTTQFEEAFCRIQVDVKVRLQHSDQSQYRHRSDRRGFKEIPEYSHLVITRQYKKYKASIKNKIAVPLHRSRSSQRKRLKKRRNSSLGPIMSHNTT